MKNRGAIIILFFIAVSFTILSFIPPEQQLGSWIRLIIFHGILSIAGLYTIYTAGILSLVGLVFSNEKLSLWARELGLISVFVWFIGTALSFVSMQVAWGALKLDEPRTVAALTMVVLGFGKEYLIRDAALKHKSWGNLIFAAMVIPIRYVLEYGMHPENPIGRSDSAAIRLFPMLMLAFTLLMIFEFSRWRLAQRCAN